MIQQYISSDLLSSIEVYELDLKSFTSVKCFAEQVLSIHNKIHLLVNNGKIKYLCIFKGVILFSMVTHFYLLLQKNKK